MASNFSTVENHNTTHSVEPKEPNEIKKPNELDNIDPFAIPTHSPTYIAEQQEREVLSKVQKYVELQYNRQRHNSKDVLAQVKHLYQHPDHKWVAPTKLTISKDKNEFIEYDKNSNSMIVRLQDLEDTLSKSCVGPIVASLGIFSKLRAALPKGESGKIVNIAFRRATAPVSQLSVTSLPPVVLESMGSLKNTLLTWLNQFWTGFKLEFTDFSQFAAASWTYVLSFVMGGLESLLDEISGRQFGRILRPYIKRFQWVLRAIAALVIVAVFGLLIGGVIAFPLVGIPALLGCLAVSILISSFCYFTGYMLVKGIFFLVEWGMDTSIGIVDKLASNAEKNTNNSWKTLLESLQYHRDNFRRVDYKKHTCGSRHEGFRELEVCVECKKNKADIGFVTAAHPTEVVFEQCYKCYAKKKGNNLVDENNDPVTGVYHMIDQIDDGVIGACDNCIYVGFCTRCVKRKTPNLCKHKVEFSDNRQGELVTDCCIEDPTCFYAELSD